jgi:hypothetical protein
MQARVAIQMRIGMTRSFRKARSYLKFHTTRLVPVGERIAALVAALATERAYLFVPAAGAASFGTKDQTRSYRSD